MAKRSLEGAMDAFYKLAGGADTARKAIKQASDEINRSNGIYDDYSDSIDEVTVSQENLAKEIETKVIPAEQKAEKQSK